MLALENRKEVPSIYFFFSILDIDDKKYLDEFTLRYFFKVCLIIHCSTMGLQMILYIKLHFQPIQKQMKMQNQEPIHFTDFSNEIFDMVRPATLNRIYIEDLLAR